MFYSTMISIDTFENPILTLASISDKSNVTLQTINQTWDFFYKQVLKLDISINKLKINDWQLELIKNIPDNEYLKKLLDNYFMLINDSNIENYIDLIDNLIINLTEQRVLTQLEERNISHINFINFIEYCGEEYKKYKLITDYKSMDNHLFELPIEDILVLEQTQFYHNEYDFKNYKLALKNSLNLSIDQNNIQTANDVLLKIKENPFNSGYLKDLLEDSRIYSLFTTYPSSDLPIINELIAMRIAKGADFDTTLANTFLSILSMEDDTRANDISNIILGYIGYGDLLLLSEFFNDSTFFKQLILKMFDKNNLRKSANIITLIENYDLIKNSLNIEDDLLLNELNKWTFDKTKLDVNKLNEEFIDDCLNAPEINISKDLMQVFNDEFKNLDKEGYETIFDDGKNIYFKYFNSLNIENLTQTSLDIFESKMVEKLKSSGKIEYQWWNILAIYESNNSTISITNTLKNILDEILNSKIELNIEIAKKLIPYFIKYDLLKEKNEVFRLIIKNEFISESEFIQLLINNSDYIKDIYRNAIQSDKDGFRNLINENREDNSEFENLAKCLDIRKSKGIS